MARRNEVTRPLLARLREGPATMSDLVSLGLYRAEAIYRLNKMLKGGGWQVKRKQEFVTSKWGRVRQSVYWLERIGTVSAE